MGAEIIDIVDGKLTIKITGKLKQSELAALQKEVGGIIDKQGKVRALIIAENFKGWEKEGDWGDVSFSARYDPQIEKIALVGAKEWEDLVLLFTAKGIRRVGIEYFEPHELDKARAWLES